MRFSLAVWLLRSLALKYCKPLRPVSLVLISLRWVDLFCYILFYAILFLFV